MANTEFDLIAAYSVFWLIALVFAANIYLRSRRLARKIEAAKHLNTEASSLDKRVGNELK